jgi:hypothetical protein
MFAANMACHSRQSSMDGTTPWRTVLNCDTIQVTEELYQAHNASQNAQLKMFHDLTAMYPQCADGYTGLLCGQCAAGYGKGSKPFSCSKCPKAKALGTVLAIGFVSVMGVLLYTIRAALVSPMTGAQLRSHQRTHRWLPVTRWHMAFRKSKGTAAKSKDNQRTADAGIQHMQQAKWTMLARRWAARPQPIAEGQLRNECASCGGPSLGTTGLSAEDREQVADHFSVDPSHAVAPHDGKHCLAPIRELQQSQHAQDIIASLSPSISLTFAAVDRAEGTRSNTAAATLSNMVAHHALGTQRGLQRGWGQAS